jgi:hypothetical protein
MNIRKYFSYFDNCEFCGTNTLDSVLADKGSIINQVKPCLPITDCDHVGAEFTVALNNVKGPSGLINAC